MKRISITFILLISFPVLFSQLPESLPEILKYSSGEEVTSVYEWENFRRQEILNLFASEVYGKFPESYLPGVKFKLTEKSENALRIRARRKQVNIEFRDPVKKENLKVNLLIYLPEKNEKPVPVILGYNFYGNHTIHSDPEILISDSWVRNNQEFHIENNIADERSRGVRISRWPVEYIVSRGYGIATIYYGDIDPDFDDGFNNGLHKFLDEKYLEQYSNDGAGSISAWAYGLSVAMDYMETDPDINNEQVVVFGHSRLGKASLWAGAMDQRFSMVISNNSGCGGAALSMRKMGETVKAINDRFPHWFCDNFTHYNDREEELPVDQHMLLALIAPRALYIASAQEDNWADPYGEQLSALLAGEVYELYGKSVYLLKDKATVNFPVKTGSVGYHLRSGPHDVRAYDWEQYLDFMDYHFGRN